MIALYIGQYSEGTTSKRRADVLKMLFPGWDFQVIDTHIPFFETPFVFRSLGFRTKSGPLIDKTNRYISDNAAEDHYDLIWTDKAVYLTQETTRVLRGKTDCMIHYTPDPAFTFHRSPHFINSLKYYDLAVTTKSYEWSHYKKHLPEDSLLFIPQGITLPPVIPGKTEGEKKKGMVFIGHYEKERGEIIRELLINEVPVAIAGIKWGSFVNKRKPDPFLTYLGTGIYGSDYFHTLGSYQFGWGALSRWVPEKHTTRTFEIPACGTALVSERNEEICSFFSEEEAILYSSPEEMIGKMKYFMAHRAELEEVTRKGHAKMAGGRFCYENQLRAVLIKAGVLA